MIYALFPYLLSITTLFYLYFKKFRKIYLPPSDFFYDKSEYTILRFYTFINSKIESILLYNHIQFLKNGMKKYSGWRKNILIYNEYILALGIIGTTINLASIIINNYYLYQISYPFLAIYIINSLWIKTRLKIQHNEIENTDPWIKNSPYIISLLSPGFFIKAIA